MIQTRSPLGCLGHGISWVGLLLMSLFVSYLGVNDLSYLLPTGESGEPIVALAIVIAAVSLWWLHHADPEDRAARSGTLFALHGSALVIVAVAFLIAIYIIQTQSQIYRGLGLLGVVMFGLFFFVVGAVVAVIGALMRARQG